MADDGVIGTRAAAFARAGLMGNPSDGYGGKAIACEIRDFHAEVTCRPAEAPTANGPLLDAARRRFERLAEARDLRLRAGHAHLTVRSDIPYQVGLAGSSAIITAAMRAMMSYHGIEIPTVELPSLVLAVETEDLGIPGGLMDRVAQVYGGVMYMDLSTELLAARGYGEYRPLPAGRLPPLFVAYRTDLEEHSGVVHGDLSGRFREGEPLVVETMDELGALAVEARDLIDADRGRELGPLMDRNLDLRDRIAPLTPGNRRLVETGRRLGAHVKFAGSGGAVVGTFEGDPEQLERLRSAYAEIGAGFFVPEID